MVQGTREEGKIPKRKVIRERRRRSINVARGIGAEREVEWITEKLTKTD